MNRRYAPPQEVLYIGPPPENRLGKTGFWTSLFGLAACGVLSPFGLAMSLLALSKKPRGYAAAGVLLGLVGSAWIALVGSLIVGGAMNAAAIEEAQRVKRTEAAMIRAEGVVKHYEHERGVLPEGIEGNKLVLQFTDAWQNPLRYDLEDDRSFMIRSAGPDGVFDSPDDLTYPRLTAHAHVNAADERDDEDGDD